MVARVGSAGLTGLVLPHRLADGVESGLRVVGLVLAAPCGRGWRGAAGLMELEGLVLPGTWQAGAGQTTLRWSVRGLGWRMAKLPTARAGPCWRGSAD